MDLVIDSVKKLEELMEHSGCENVDVILDVDPDRVNCQYEKGACMTAIFGGRSADFTTFDPIRARTKISFMFGAPLDNSSTRGAACVIVNAAAGFFCISRVLHACQPCSHDTCSMNLKEELAGKKIWCVGEVPGLDMKLRYTLADSPSDAELIIIGSEGIIADGTGDLIETWRGKKRIICIGPSTAGTARLHELELWCPCGKN